MINNTITSTSNSCQIVNTINAKLNTNKKIDELNNLLMSQLEIDASSHFKCINNNNLNNLRDVLKAAHKLNLNSNNKKIDSLYESTQISSQDQSKKHDSLTSLIDILKQENQNNTNNVNSLNEQEKCDQQSQNILNKIEKDLQDSLKLLKQYNDNLVIDEDDYFDENKLLNNYKNMNELFQAKSIKKYSLINDTDPVYLTHEDELNIYNFNRNDLIRKNVFSKNENLCEKLKKYHSIKHDSNERSNLIDNEKVILRSEHNVSSPSLKKLNDLTFDLKMNSNQSQRRNSIDQIPLSLSFPKHSSSMTKSSTSQFNYEKMGNDLNTFTGNLENSKDEKFNFSSGFWNYDELNELKMKFISLLSENSKSDKNDELIKNTALIEQTKANILMTDKFKEKQNLDVYCLIDNNNLSQKNFSSASFLSVDQKPISSSEQLKIESFYRSFGTSLFISQTCASLYTVPNSKVSLQPFENQNRMSIATTSPVKFTPEIMAKTPSNEINHQILRDLMNNKHESYISVNHRGVPLWLFNSGKNPRRPVRQLKFTLAEKGTGFILWQDRIDSHSDFNLYLIKKNDTNIQNVSSYFDNLNLLNEIKQELIESMLVVFKASDKKTTVFIKFDINTETIKFYEYYKRLVKNIISDIKQRTKSLPIGVGNVNMNNNKFKKQTKSDLNALNRLNGKNISFYNYDYNLLENNPNSSQNQKSNTSKLKRQSCHITTETTNSIKWKKITKNDISSPCNYKHIINIKASDKNLFYTLSKLLPVSISTTNSNISSPNSVTNKSTPSPNYSITSSISTPTSSYLANHNIITSLNSTDSSIQETSHLSFNQENFKSINRSISSSSNSSLSNILPPLIKLNNSNKLFEINYNNQKKNQKTVK